MTERATEPGEGVEGEGVEAAAAGGEPGNVATGGGDGHGSLPWGRVVAVGVLAGVVSGLFGVGGGVITVPALVAVAGFAHKTATGTSLTAIVPVAASGVVGYGTAGEVDWWAALAIVAGALLGTLIGTQLLRHIQVATLQYLFALLMLIAAVRMFMEVGVGDGRGDLDPAALAALVLIGVASGVLAGLFGIGGGVLIVPALALGFGLPLALAKGTSLAVIVPTAVIGTVRNRAAGFTALRPAAVVGAAGVVSAFLASQVSVRLDEQLAAALFALLMAFMAVRMVRSARAQGRTAAV